MIRVGSADALGSRVLAPQDRARDLLSEETWPKTVPPSFLWSAYLSEATRMPWEGIPHHNEGTSEDTKIGPLFLCVISGSKVTARREESLQLVLLEEDLCIHSAAGDTLGSAVWFDQLQLGIRQVFLSNLWQGNFPLWFQQLWFVESGDYWSFGRDCRWDICLLLLFLALLWLQWDQAGHTGDSLP